MSLASPYTSCNIKYKYHFRVVVAGCKIINRVDFTGIKIYFGTIPHPSHEADPMNQSIDGLTRDSERRPR